MQSVDRAGKVGDAAEDARLIRSEVERIKP